MALSHHISVCCRESGYSHKAVLCLPAKNKDVPPSPFRVRQHVFVSEYFYAVCALRMLSSLHQTAACRKPGTASTWQRY